MLAERHFRTCAEIWDIWDRRRSQEVHVSSIEEQYTDEMQHGAA